MKKQLTAVLALSAPVVLAAMPSFAEDLNATSRFTWEGEIEIGYESVFDSTVAANEGDAAYASGELAGEFALGENSAIFGGLTFEEVEDPTGATGYGFYLHELGLKFGVGNTTFQIGKVSPVFGTAWDGASGFYATALAEDYELGESLGGLAEVEFSDGSVLSLGVFFTDNSILSESAGFNRTRNTTAAGGAANTGKLNNVSIQWAKEIGSTRFNLGIRSLHAGTGDVKDETGIVAGIGHSFDGSLDLYAEVASFEGFGGGADDATYVTLNAAYGLGNWTLSGTYARRDITSAGVTSLASIGADYEFRNGMSLGGAFAMIDDAGVKDKLFGVSLVIPFGG